MKTLACSLAFVYFFTQIAFAHLPFGAALPQAGRPIVLIQDVHGHLEAQKNIALFLDQRLKESKQKSLAIGVEGATGLFRFEIYRAFPDTSLIKGIGEDLLAEDRIAAAEYFGLTHPSARLMGVEEPDLYRKNVEAYLSAYPLQEKLKKNLAKSMRRLASNFPFEINSPTCRTWPAFAKRGESPLAIQ